MLFHKFVSSSEDQRFEGFHHLKSTDDISSLVLRYYYSILFEISYWIAIISFVGLETEKRFHSVVKVQSLCRYTSGIDIDGSSIPSNQSFNFSSSMHQTFANWMKWSCRKSFPFVLAYFRFVSGAHFISTWLNSGPVRIGQLITDSMMI